MHSRHSASNPHAAQVILCESALGSRSEPKIIHTVKISPRGVASEAHERGIRETIAFDGGFAQLPSEGAIRETLPHIPHEFWSTN